MPRPHLWDVQGKNDWRNISDIVRATFKAFHDVLMRHDDCLETLTKVVDEKASHADVSSALESSATEVCSRLQGVERQIEELPDRAVWVTLNVHVFISL